MFKCCWFGCLFDQTTEVQYWSSDPHQDHWQEQKPSRRKKEGEVGRNEKAQCEMFHYLTAELLHFCLTNESLRFEWHHWSLFFHSMPSSSSSLSFFSHSLFAVHRPSLPTTIVSLFPKSRQAIQDTLNGKHNSYTLNRTVYSRWFSLTPRHTFTNSLTWVSAHTHQADERYNKWWPLMALSEPAMVAEWSSLKSP